MYPSSQMFCTFLMVFYTTVCDYGIAHSFVEGSLIVVSRLDHPTVVIEDIDVTVQLANRDTISPIGIVRDVEVLCGKIKYPTDFIVLGSPQDEFCPIIFGRPFLNTVNARIDYEK